MELITLFNSFADMFEPEGKQSPVSNKFSETASP